MIIAKGRVNFFDLKRTRTASLWEAYSEVEEAASGSISSSYDISPDNQFDVLFASYELTEFQKHVVECMYPVFDNTANIIDPEKLVYDISMNSDQDLILSRDMDEGLSSLIIHDDELIVYSFISSVNKEFDIFDIYEDVRKVDFEKLVYEFLKFQK